MVNDCIPMTCRPGTRYKSTAHLLPAYMWVYVNHAQKFVWSYQRNTIWKCTCVCLCAQCAFECLVYMHQVYYRHMSAYIQEVFNISVKAMREDEEDVALQVQTAARSVVVPRQKELPLKDKSLITNVMPKCVHQIK